jgi:hypothetical protein
MIVKSIAHRGKSLTRLWLLSITLLSAFAQAIGPFGKSKTPEWAIDQVPDTAHTLYGVGSGRSIEAAKQSALEDIAGKLITNVQSTTKQLTQASNGKVSESFSRNIQTSVEKMGLGGYVVDKSEKKGKTHWVRLSLEKSKLFNTTKTQLNPVMLELNDFFASLGRKSALSARLEQEHVASLISDARGKAFVMSAANQGYKVSALQQKLAAYESALNSKVNNLSVYIQAGNQMGEFGEKLAHQFGQEGWVASTRAPKANSIKISLNGSFRDGIQFGAKFSAATVDVRVTNELGELVSQQQLNIHGTSQSSHQLARQIAVNKFIDDASIYGVAQKFGLEQ